MDEIIEQTQTPENTPQRARNGFFCKGNTMAAGHRNPQARQRQAFTDEFLRIVKPADFRRVIKKLIEMAAGGDIIAIRELLDRLLGRPKIPDETEEREPINISIKFPPELEDV